MVVFEFEGCCLEKSDYKRFFLLRHVTIQELALASGQVDWTCIHFKNSVGFSQLSLLRVLSAKLPTPGSPGILLNVISTQKVVK